MNKEELFRVLHASNIERDKYMDSIPREFRECILFNDYVRSLHNDFNTMLDFVFQEHSYSVSWFLFDWEPGFTVSGIGEKECPIHNIDEMIDWMKKNEGF